MSGTRYFYAGHPNSIVAVEPTTDGGVTLSITAMGTDEQLCCAMSAGSFRELISEGSDALAEAGER